MQLQQAVTVQQQNSNNGLTFDEFPQHVVQNKLANLLRTAIGKDNAVSLKEMMEYVFTKERLSQILRENPSQIVVLSYKIYSALSNLRKHSDFFTINEKINGTSYWYILKTKEELVYYRRQNNSKIRRIESMTEKAETFVEREMWKKLID